MNIEDRLRKIKELTLLSKVLTPEENNQFDETQHVEFLRMLADKFEEKGITNQ